IAAAARGRAAGRRVGRRPESAGAAGVGPVEGGRQRGVGRAAAPAVVEDIGAAPGAGAVGGSARGVVDGGGDAGAADEAAAGAVGVLGNLDGHDLDVLAGPGHAEVVAADGARDAGDGCSVIVVLRRRVGVVVAVDEVP